MAMAVTAEGACTLSAHPSTGDSSDGRISGSGTVAQRTVPSTWPTSTCVHSTQIRDREACVHVSECILGSYDGRGCSVPNVLHGTDDRVVSTRQVHTPVLQGRPSRRVGMLRWSRTRRRPAVHMSQGCHARPLAAKPESAERRRQRRWRHHMRRQARGVRGMWRTGAPRRSRLPPARARCAWSK